MLKLLLINFFTALPLSASAHSLLLSSSPSDGSSLVSQPTKIDLVFAEPVKLIKIKLVTLEAEKETLLGKLLGKEKLIVPLTEEFVVKTAQEHQLRLPHLEPGNYSITWRAIGQDGHIIKGELHFDLTGK